MTRTQVQSLNDEELGALIRSTNPSGRYWMQLAWARTEVARRQRRAA